MTNDVVKFLAEQGHVQSQRMFERQTKKFFTTPTAQQLSAAVTQPDDFTNCWNGELLDEK